MEAKSVGARPLTIDLVRTERLQINWDDGHLSVYPLPLLRKACPCATCRTQREQEPQTRLPILNVKGPGNEMAQVENAELVGNYAIRFVWRDNHDTGIYDFRYLRSICPCPICAAGK